MCIRQNSKNKIILLHSKLRTKQWPNIKNILEKIVLNLPKVDIRINFYDTEKENKENTDRYNTNQSQDDLKISRFEKMNVNIFLLNIPQINELSKNSCDGIYIIT